jgi:hypothetical protein
VEGVEEKCTLLAVPRKGGSVVCEGLAKEINDYQDCQLLKTWCKLELRVK